MSDHQAALHLDTRTARRLFLDWQSLLPPRSLSGNKGMRTWLERIRCVQFDPLDRCGRNADLTLQARVRGYRPKMLRDAVERDAWLVEGWDKQMSFYSTEDWPGMARVREGFKRHHLDRFGDREQLLSRVLDEVASRGPLCSLDIKNLGRVDWHWAPTTAGRAALEALFYEGRLLITRREGNRKYYDLPERVIPADIATAAEPRADYDEFITWRLWRRLRATGMMRASHDAWLGIDADATARVRALGRLTETGEAVPVILDPSGVKVWIAADAMKRIGELPSGSIPSPRAALLAPLDNLMWDRSLIETLFGFEYVWEVYKPVSERRWGYYVLPVLYGDRLVARCEPVRDRKKNVLVLANWIWEPGIKPSARLGTAIRRAMAEFLRFLNLPSICPVGNSWPAHGLDALNDLKG